MKFAAEVALVTALALGQICAAQCSQPTPGAKQALSIEAHRLGGKVKLGSSVLLKVRMTNMSPHDISVWMENGISENQYEVDVRGQKTNLSDLIDSGSCVTLGKGKSIVQQVDIGKLYLFDIAGKYFIRVRRPDPESAGMVESNAVRVTITSE